MSSSALEALAERWVPGSGPVTLQPLPSGLVNASYRAARAGSQYVLRIAAPGLDDLGRDRAWECRILREAATAELAPKLLECNPQQGVVVAEWVIGRAWLPGEVREPPHIAAMAALLRRVHALPIPQPARVMNPADWIAHYSARCAGNGGAMSPMARALSRAAAHCLQRLTKLTVSAPVICHSDLHRLNILVRESGGTALLLDWEYAHVSDGFWDLAGWVANNDWAQDDAARLLAQYLGRTPQAAEALRLRLLGWLYDYVCLLWSEVFSSRRPAGDAAAVQTRAGLIAARLSGGLPELDCW